MVTKTYKKNLTIQLKVEDDSKDMADIAFSRLIEQVKDELPTGVKLIVEGITKRA